MIKHLVRLCVLLIVMLIPCSSEEWVRATAPDYADLEQKLPSNTYNDQGFIRACEEMAGYYKDPNKNPSLKKTILIVGVNNGYKDFFHNFKCFMDRLGIKFLAISLDEGVYGYLTNNKIPSYLMTDIPGRDKVAAEPAGFGGRNFNLIGCRKMEAVGAALTLGYDVIFSDVDIAIVRDPIDYLFLNHIDYVHSTNNGCAQKWKFNDTMEGNTGFYAVKSTPETIRTWDLTYRLCARSPRYDDQTIFWLILRTNANPSPRPLPLCPQPDTYYMTKKIKAIPEQGSNRHHSIASMPNTVTSCPLDSCMFSAGNIRDFHQQQMLVDALRRKNDFPIIIHANWLSGKENKKSALVRAGLWIARRGGGGAGVQGSVQSKQKQSGNWTCMPISGNFRDF